LGARQLLRLPAEDRKRQRENPRFPRSGTFANPGAGPTAFARALRALPETERTQKRSKTPSQLGANAGLNANGYAGYTEDDGAHQCVGEKARHAVTALRGLELRHIEVSFFERLREATSYEIVT